MRAYRESRASEQSSIGCEMFIVISMLFLMNQTSCHKQFELHTLHTHTYSLYTQYNFIEMRAKDVDDECEVKIERDSSNNECREKTKPT